MDGRRSRCAAMAALLVATGPLRWSVPAQGPSSTAEAPPAFVDVVALDSSGRPIPTLGAADFQVVIDGRPRAIRSVRYVFRGPGAAASVRALSQQAGTPALAEPSRLVLLVVDEASFTRGSEASMVSAAWRVLDAAAPADHVAVLTVPVPRGGAMLSTDRQPVRTALASLTGRATPARDLARADQPRPGAPDPQVVDDDPEPSRERPIAGREPTAAGSAPGPVPANPAATPGSAPGPGTDAAARESNAPPSDEPPPTSLQVLALLLADLTEIPGPKTAVYLWAGASGSDARDPSQPGDSRPELEAVVDAAAASRTNLHVVSLARTRSDTEARLERLARDTGATFARWKGKDRRIDALSGALSGSFLIELEGRAEDRNGHPHTLDVRTSRKGVTTLAAARWAPRDDPLPAPIETPALGPPATAPSATRDPTVTPARPTSAAPLRSDPVLDAVLTRVSEYLDTYLKEFSDVVAEEDYSQRIMAWNNRERESVRLRSDLLLVQTGDADGWTPFRDVFEVNNRPVRDREDRLRKLFLERPGAALAEARRITEESARYNIGPIERTINMPTLPLLFLAPSHLPSFRFERRREDTVEGLRVLQIDYEEVGRPTVIRDGSGRSRPSTGSLWVDPTTGRIVKTTLRNGDRSVRLDATVVYRRSETLGLWAPAEMTETYRMLTSRETVVGAAKYSNFRRFKVDTEVVIGNPKQLQN